MEHTVEHRVDEKDMHPDYAKREERFREKAAKLWDQEMNARERIRSNIGLTDEERQEKYMEAYKGLEKRLDSLVDEFGRDVSKDIKEATQTLYGGPSGAAGKKFSEHLASVANVSDDRLEQLMNTAARSGQDDLARAIAVTAYERGQRGLFNRWAEANPERAAALERIKGTPGAEQLYTRTARAMRVPKATVEDLVPTAEDERLAAEAAARRNAPRAEFFGSSATVRRQVGRRVVS